MIQKILRFDFQWKITLETRTVKCFKLLAIWFLWILWSKFETFHSSYVMLFDTEFHNIIKTFLRNYSFQFVEFMKWKNGCFNIFCEFFVKSKSYIPDPSQSFCGEASNLIFSHLGTSKSSGQHLVRFVFAFDRYVELIDLIFLQL